MLAATYGLLVTEDRGQNWFHVCEAAFAEPGQQTDPVVALTADGGLLTSTFNALQRSSTGVCDFARHLGGNPSQAVPDFTVDATGAVIAVLITTANGATTSQLQESRDGGQTFHALGPPLPDSLRLVATVDVAPSDPQRIYLSGWGPSNAGVLLRSDDRGQTYTAKPLATDAESDEVPFIAAVDPKNADALYVRTDLWKFDPDFGLPTAGDALLYSNDGGDSFSELIRRSGKLFGFALSPDDQELLVGYGDPVEGGGRVVDADALGIYRAPAGSDGFQKVFDGPVSCLTWSAQGVYACTGQVQLGFALGFAARDDLKANGSAPLTPLLSLLDVRGPNECPACTTGARCGEYWRATCEAWGRTDCEAPTMAAGGAAECPAVAGSDSGGAGGEATSSAGGTGGTNGPVNSPGGVPASSGSATAAGTSTVGPSASEPSGCGCHAAGSSHTPGLAALALLGLGLVWRRRGAALLLSALALAGCGTSNHAPTPAAHEDGEDGEECTGDFDTFERGMTKQALPGNITVELTDAAPSPPVVRLDNIWWLKLSDADGAAVSGAQLVASPYMPKHQHGSAEVVVEEQSEGEYQLSPIELIMPGVWEIPLSITSEGEQTSETTFRFCIAER